MRESRCVLLVLTCLVSCFAGGPRLKAGGQVKPGAVQPGLAQFGPAQPKLLNRNGVTFVWRTIKVTAPDGPGDKARPLHEVTPGYGTLTASWPEAMIANPEWNAWNEAMRAAAMRMSEADMDSESAVPTKWAAQPGVDSDVTVSIGVVERQLISATVTALWDSHGAHPSHGSREFSWLLEQKRELKPEDVFKPDSGWEQALQSRTDAYLHKQLDRDGQNYESFAEPGEMPKTLHQIVTSPENWRVDAKGLSIVFQPYAVACYACTPPPFAISWAELKPLMNAEFVAPVAPAR
jgi:Protein of unknown function (DUF3298)